MKLFIRPTSDATRALYETAAAAYNATPVAERNSGFDLFCDTKLSDNRENNTVMIGQGCQAVAMDAEGRFRAYWLVPRSSISKTPFALRNSIGLIDATYRGEVIAAVACVGLKYGIEEFSEGSHQRGKYFDAEFNWDLLSDHGVKSLLIADRNRICQLATPDLLPWDSVEIVTELPGGPTLRGAGGFGSTGAGAASSTA